jgi:hypothetical protein
MATEQAPSHWPQPSAKLAALPGAIEIWNRICRELDWRDLTIPPNGSVFIGHAVSAHLLCRDLQLKLPPRMDVWEQAAAEGLLTTLNHQVSECLESLGLPRDLFESE